MPAAARLAHEALAGSPSWTPARVPVSRRARTVSTSLGRQGWPWESARPETQRVMLGLAYFACGMSPIAALCLTVVGLWPLGIGVLALCIPAVFVGTTLGGRFPEIGRVALRGLFAGIIAVAAYDCVRAPFVLSGLWADFIPRIGGWLLGTGQPNWVLGYAYRYLGNGGGMGMAFTSLYCICLARRGNHSSVLPGVGYGVAIWGCLLATIAVSPRGEAMLFHITPLSLAVSFLGHVVYGATLGIVIDRWGLARAARRQPSRFATTVLVAA